MKAESKKIFEAHVAYEMAQWEGDHLRHRFHDEVTAAHVWLSKQKLQDIVPKQHVKDSVHRWFQHIVISDEYKSLGIKIVESALDYIQDNDLQPEDILKKDTYDKIVDAIVEQKEIREAIIHKVISNPFYGEMISDMLYNGIKNFVQQFGDTLSGGSKGGGGLFNIGKGLIGAALSGLEENLDKNVKKFLSENINKTMRDNEKLLNEKLSDRNIRKIADKLYAKMADWDVKKGIEKFKKSVDEEQAQKIADISVEILAELRDSQTVRGIFESGVDAFYDTYGKKSLSVLSKDANYDPKIFAEEAYITLYPAIKKMYESGYIESRIRHHLEGFYKTL
jgi:hypothetical protein